MRVRKATWPSRPGAKPGGGGGTASSPWSDPGAVGAVVTASSSSWLAPPCRCIGGRATGDRVASVTGGVDRVALHIAWWVRYPGEGSMAEQLATMRVDYARADELDVGDLAPTWHEQLALWMDEAITDGVAEPNAMVLATTGE